jgi:hypothetical protein
MTGHGPASESGAWLASGGDAGIKSPSLAAWSGSNFGCEVSGR